MPDDDDARLRLGGPLGIGLAVVVGAAMVLCLGVALLMLPWWLAAQDEEEYQREYDRTSTPSVSASPR
jgi:uncharacterized membrane protein